MIQCLLKINVQVKILGSLLGFSRGEDIFSSEKQQHPIFWDQALDLMAEPMTPVAMELRASPKAPRLTLSWRGRFWSKCYIIYLVYFCNGSINAPGRSCGGGVCVFNRRFSVGSQPLVNHRTASFSHQVVLEIGIMPPVRFFMKLTMKKSGFSSRQASICANSGLSKVEWLRIRIKIVG